VKRDPFPEPPSQSSVRVGKGVWGMGLRKEESRSAPLKESSHIRESNATRGAQEAPRPIRSRIWRLIFKQAPTAR
jgi:hypothetical protein